jgi:hypothetical protein
MDGDQFDGLTRRLATGGTTRRRLLRDLGGAAGAMLVGIGVRPAMTAAQDSDDGAHAMHGRRAGQALSDYVADACDSCNFECTNCN